MTLSESPNQQALRELGGTTCAACDRPKNEKQSFCHRCYFRLPSVMRSKLYRRFGSGYEEAYDDAKDWLRQERKAAGK